ncbi:MAG: carbohydrate ABC transporter permease [Paenibacillaceae bacterium]|nr:carbohydrate ABC transporter permease [Paenibacillaceae bacterium]
MVTYAASRKRRFGLFDIGNVVFLTIAAFSMIYPFLYMLAVSLSDSNAVLRNEVKLWPKGFNLRAYELVLGDHSIMTGYRNTIVYVLLGTAIALIVTASLAYALSRRNLVFGKTITLLIIFTMMFNGGMIPTFLVVKSLGIMNSIWAMVLPGAVSTWNMFVMRTFFAGLPKELEESGRMDGLNDIGILMRIIIPLTKPIMVTIGLFYAVAIWNNYTFPLLYLRSESLYPLQVIIRRLLLTASLNNNMGGDSDTVDQVLKFASIIIGTLPIIMAYPFLQKHFVKGVLIGSVKG